MKTNSEMLMNPKELLDKLIESINKYSEDVYLIDYNIYSTKLKGEILSCNNSIDSFMRKHLSDENGRMIRYKDKLFYISANDTKSEKTTIELFIINEKGNTLAMRKTGEFPVNPREIDIDRIGKEVARYLTLNYPEVIIPPVICEKSNRRRFSKRSSGLFYKNIKKKLMDDLFSDDELRECEQEYKTIYDKCPGKSIPNAEIIRTEEYISYPILYGTCRKEASDPDKETLFGKERGEVLSLGMCRVSIPRKHKMCTIERPGWFRELLGKESPQKDFVILDNEVVDAETFIKLLKDRFADSEQNDVLLFVHGYNVTFKDAMFRTAQLGYDLSFKGATTAFSWASCGTVKEYMTDVENAKYSAFFLCEYIKFILDSTAINKLHIIAHSMGNAVLCEALNLLKEEGKYPNEAINQIILAAPDIDKSIFINQIWTKIKKEQPNITLYASDKDKALLVSKTLRSGYERLGEVGKGIIITDGLDSIDASEVDTNFLGHGYFSETESLLHDIHEILIGIRPKDRMLDPCGQYWKLKRT